MKTKQLMELRVHIILSIINIWECLNFAFKYLHSCNNYNWTSLLHGLQASCQLLNVTLSLYVYMVLNEYIYRFNKDIKHNWSTVLTTASQVYSGLFCIKMSRTKKRSQYSSAKGLLLWLHWSVDFPHDSQSLVSRFFLQNIMSIWICFTTSHIIKL